MLESNKNETENNKDDQGTDVKQTKEIPEFTIEELQAVVLDALTHRALSISEVIERVAGCHRQTQKQETATESKPKASKHATRKRKKW